MITPWGTETEFDVVLEDDGKVLLDMVSYDNKDAKRVIRIYGDVIAKLIKIADEGVPNEISVITWSVYAHVSWFGFKVFLKVGPSMGWRE